MVDLIKELEDPQRYHYKDLWMSDEDPANADILEIFSFGDMTDIRKAGIAITELMDVKLKKLYIIDRCNKQRVLRYNEVEVSDIEEMMMQLNEVIDFEIDSIGQEIIIKRCFECRDVYCYEKPLNLVDVGLLSTDRTLIEALKQWKNKLNDEIGIHNK